MAGKGRSVGKNLRKRSIRMVRSEQHLEFHSEVGAPRLNLNWETSPPENAQILARLQALFLEAHRHQLEACATRLGSVGCWQYGKKFADHAKRLKYEQDFWSLVASAARRFAGKSVRTANEPVTS